MTDSDDKLLRRYRELAREEPTRALDDAILAASRRAVAKRSWSRRFAAPVSIAAVLVLAFGLTLEMMREEPGVEYSAPREEKREEPKPAARQAPMESRSAAAPRPMKEAAPAAKVQEATSPAGVAPPAPFAKEMRRAPEAFAPSPQSAPAASAAPMDAMRDANVAPASPAARATAGALVAPRAKSEMQESRQAPARAPAAAGASAASSELEHEPERELERIARLREEKRDDEADRALADFKRRYPDFRIPDAMLSRVAPR
jgi:hypothetical protein